jgi:predicted transcriptional regulator
MRRTELGELEAAVLRFIADEPPLTVGQVYEQFGKPRGLARNTILTIMERLRRKGYLERNEDHPVNHYLPTQGKAQIMHGLVSQFVQKMLNGSVEPLVAYLTQSRDLSEEEVAELHRLLDQD